MNETNHETGTDLERLKADPGSRTWPVSWLDAAVSRSLNKIN